MPDVLIIGAGPAGSMAAALLARRGYQGAGARAPEVPALLDRRKPARLQHGAARGGRHGRSRDGARLPVQERRGVRPQRRTLRIQLRREIERRATRSPSRCRAPISMRRWPREAQRQGAEIRFEVEITAVDFSGEQTQGHQPHRRWQRPKCTSRASCSTPRASAARCPNYSTCIARPRFRRAPPSSRTCATTPSPARSTGRRSASAFIRRITKSGRG